MSTYTQDMTNGNEMRHILRFTIPLLFGNLFQQFYNIIDSVIVGRYLGKDAIAAVGATGSITYLFYTLCIGLSIGAGILISQAFGAKKKSETKKLIANSAYVLIALGIIISIISAVLAKPLLILLDTPTGILNDSVSYMRIACLGTAAVAAYNWINSALRSLGDSKTPLIFLVIASILNVLLDLLMVIVLDMGVSGAALATVLSQAISAVGSILFAFFKNQYFRLKGHEAMPDKNLIILCIKTGVPIALQNALISVSMVFLQKTANSFKETVMAAYTVTMRIEQLIQQPFTSLNAAVSTFTGQNVGAGKTDRVIKGYKNSLKASFIFAGAMLALFLIFANVIVKLFVTDPDVVSIGSNALRVSACFYFFLGMIHVTRGLLNGAGDVSYAFINGIAKFVGRVGFAFILSHIAFIGYWAVWGTTCLTWVLTALMSIFRYRGKKWQSKKLV